MFRGAYFLIPLSFPSFVFFEIYLSVAGVPFFDDHLVPLKGLFRVHAPDYFSIGWANSLTPSGFAPPPLGLPNPRFVLASWVTCNLFDLSLLPDSPSFFTPQLDSFVLIWMAF